MVLAIALSGCTSQPASPVIDTAVVSPQNQYQTDRSNAYLPFPGEWTVGDVFRAYGNSVKDKLGYYFQKAHVAYPPREMALLAFKQEKKLELWARDHGEFRLIRDYFIMAASGDAGPKLKQGDRQVPEGIYRITDLNPNSHYHLSMKINYPNEFDLTHAEMDGRSDLGSDIFIHGKDASIGCLAMGDAAIRELFILTAQVGVNNVKVVIAPHDPKSYPLASSEELPVWTSELYAMISQEIEAVTSKVKSAKSPGYTQQNLPVNSGYY